MVATIDQVRQNLPNQAQRQGQANSRQFMSEYFTHDGANGRNGGHDHVRFVDLDEGANGNPTRRSR